MNVSLSNFGKTLDFYPAAEPFGAMPDLVRALNAGEVETLVILGGNPVYSAPADLDWARAQTKSRSIVRLASCEDETFEAGTRADDWHLPMAHYLESWGDAMTSDGRLVSIQPLISPLFGGVTEIEVLARIAGEGATGPYHIVRETFAMRLRP